MLLMRCIRMENQFEKLYSLPRDLYLDGSPALIVSGDLLRDKDRGDVFLLLKIRNLFHLHLTFCQVNIKCFGPNKEQVLAAIKFAYDGIRIQPNADFGNEKLICISNKTTRRVEISVIKLKFSDGTVWQYAPVKWTQVKFKKQRIASKSITNRAKQLNDGYVYYPEKCGSLYLCTCGAINFASEQRCLTCNKNFNLLASMIKPENSEKNSLPTNTLGSKNPSQTAVSKKSHTTHTTKVDVQRDLNIQNKDNTTEGPEQESVNKLIAEIQNNALGRIERERAEREKAERERAEREKAERDKAARDKAARDKAAQEKAARDKAAQDKAARDKAARDKAAQEKAAQEKAEHERIERVRIEQEEAEAQRAKQQRDVREKKRNTKKFQIEVTWVRVSRGILIAAILLAMSTLALTVPKIQREEQYRNALNLLAYKQYDAAITAFTRIEDYKDARRLAIVSEQEKDFDSANKLLEEDDYEAAISILKTLGEYKEANRVIAEIEMIQNKRAYISANKLIAEGRYADAIEVIDQMENVESAINLKEKIKELREKE